MTTFPKYIIAFHYWLKLNLYNTHVSFTTKLFWSENRKREKEKQGKYEESQPRGNFRTLSNIWDGAFEKIVNGFYLLTVFGKKSILDVWHALDYVSAAPVPTSLPIKKTNQKKQNNKTKEVQGDKEINLHV